MKSFEIYSLTFQSTTIWNVISTIYQVINLQKSRHLSPPTTLPQSFIGQYTLTVEAFVNFAIRPVVHATKFSLIPLVDETQLLTMVKIYAKMYAKFRKFILLKKL